MQGGNEDALLFNGVSLCVAHSHSCPADKFQELHAASVQQALFSAVQTPEDVERGSAEGAAGGADTSSLRRQSSNCGATSSSSSSLPSSSSLGRLGSGGAGGAGEAAGSSRGGSGTLALPGTAGAREATAAAAAAGVGKSGSKQQDPVQGLRLQTVALEEELRRKLQALLLFGRVASGKAAPAAAAASLGDSADSGMEVEGAAGGRSSSSSSKAVTFKAASAEELRLQVLLLQDSVREKDKQLTMAQARLQAVELEAHRATRTLERLRFDHPDLDIDAHASNPTAHGTVEAGAGVGTVNLQRTVSSVSSSAGAGGAEGGGAAAGLTFTLSGAAHSAGMGTPMPSLSRAPSNFTELSSSSSAAATAGATPMASPAAGLPHLPFQHLQQQQQAQKLGLPLPGSAAAAAGIAGESVGSAGQCAHCSHCGGHAGDSASRGVDDSFLSAGSSQEAMLHQLLHANGGSVAAALSQLSASNSSAAGGAAAGGQAASAAALASLTAELEQAQEEAEVMRGLADEREGAFQEAQRRAEELQQQLTSVLTRGVTEAAILASPAYCAKAAELQKAEEAVRSLEASLIANRAVMAGLQNQLAAAEARAQELLQFNAAAEGKAAAALESQLQAMQAQLTALRQERDAALGRGAASAADAASGVYWKVQAEQLVLSRKELLLQFSGMRADWTANIAKSSAVAGLLQKHREELAGGSGAAAASTAAEAELESAKQEKEQLAQMIDSVSSSYEEASAQLTSLQEALLAKNEEMSSLQGVIQKLRAELTLQAGAKTALEAQQTEQQTALRAAEAAAAAQSRALETLREQLSERDRDILALQSNYALVEAFATSLSGGVRPAVLPAPVVSAGAGSMPGLPAGTPVMSRQPSYAGDRERERDRGTGGAAPGTPGAVSMGHSSSSSSSSHSSSAIPAVVPPGGITADEAARRALELQKRIAQVQQLQQQLAEAERLCAETEKRAGSAAEEKRKMSEEVLQLQKKLSKLTEKHSKLKAEGSASAGGAGGASSGLHRHVSAGSDAGGDGEGSKMNKMKEEQLQMLRALMECSVCHQNYKDAVITKCFHLFCKECLDKNVKIRHRKCPACGLAFGADDIRTVHFVS